MPVQTSKMDAGSVPSGYPEGGSGLAVEFFARNEVVAMESLHSPFVTAMAQGTLSRQVVMQCGAGLWPNWQQHWGLHMGCCRSCIRYPRRDHCAPFPMLGPAGSAWRALRLHQWMMAGSRLGCCWGSEGAGPPGLLP